MKISPAKKQLDIEEEKENINPLKIKKSRSHESRKAQAAENFNRGIEKMNKFKEKYDRSKGIYRKVVQNLSEARNGDKIRPMVD